jgi:hypothetical protein
VPSLSRTGVPVGNQMSSWSVDNETMTHRGSRRNAMPWLPESGTAALTHQTCEFDFEFASAYLTEHAAFIEDGTR